MGEVIYMGVETVVMAGLALSAGSQIIGGAMDMGAYNEQAQSYQKQAVISQQESALEAKQKQLEIDKLAARQVMGMAKNGIITSEGSPLLILNETINQGKEEVNAINRRGSAMTEYYNTMAKQSTNEGRSALLSGFTGAASTAISGYYGGAKAGLWGSTAAKTTTAATKSVNPNLVDGNAFPSSMGTMFS